VLCAVYWVWAPLAENLRSIGYDDSSMSLMSYDWRLNLADVEVRPWLVTLIWTYDRKVIKVISIVHIALPGRGGGGSACQSLSVQVRARPGLDCAGWHRPVIG
jgi:hypothetical protein